MAIVHFVKNRRTQTVGGLRGVLSYCCKAAKVDYEGRPLVSGVNCVPQAALQEFLNTKHQYHSTGGRMYYHMVQSFRPDDPVTPEMAHEIALKLAEQIPGYEIVVATHTDRDHIHSHFVINSVSCDTGKKYHSNKESLMALREASDRLCMEYGLSVVEPQKKQKQEHTMSAREYRAYDKGNSWKMDLEINIDECMTLARDRAHFIRLMEYSGYEVRWEDARKYITYTTPEGHKCRDIKLNGRKYHNHTYSHWYPIFAVMLGSGLRVGEVTGLRWCDIDLDEGIIDVNHTLVYYDHRNESGKTGCYFNVHTPKTEAGKRQVPMLDFVKEAFIMEREYQQALNIHCHAVIDGFTDFIFVNRFGDTQHQGTLNKAIRRIIRDCNDEVLMKGEENPVLLPHFSCHSLRHTFTTRMCEAGVNVKVIQDALGHADISTTLNIYADVTKELKKDEFAGLDSFFKGEPKKSQTV